MFDKLSLGGLSALGNITGFKPENISTDIANWSYNIGKRAGNYILNDSGLHDAYSHAGPIGKTAITFHAAVQSGIQSAVEDIANWASGVEKRAANYILNDSNLHDAYNDAGVIGKTAIAFHATVQSGIQSAVESIGNWFQSLWS